MPHIRILTKSALLVGISCLALPALAAAAPRIDSISPNRGVPGKAVIIRGVGFNPQTSLNQVQFAGSGLVFPLPTKPVSVNATGTEMTVIVPPASGTGPVKVYNGSSTSNGLTFTILAPTIFSISPNRGAPGTTVTFLGRNFSPDATLNLIQFAASGLIFPFRVAAESVNPEGTEMTVIVPAGSGTGPVTVFNSSITSPGFSFTVPLPRIASITPERGVPGTRVVFRGEGFSPDATLDLIQFAGFGVVFPLRVAPERVNPDGTEMTVIVPPGSGTGPVTVFNSSATSPGASFTVLRPRITSISPDHAAIGSTVAIVGENFSPEASFNRIRFAGSGLVFPLLVEPESVDSDGTAMRVVVPRATGSGPVSLTNGSFESNEATLTVIDTLASELLVGTAFGDNVRRFDGTNGSAVGEMVTARSGGLDFALGIAAGPDGHLYVSSRDTDSVLRFDGETGVFLDTFASGGGLDNPTALTFGPDGHLYVSGFLSHEVLRFDGATGRFLDVFTSGGPLIGAEGLQFGPGGDLYVASFNTDSVLRYDGTSGAFVETFASGGGLEGPIGIVFGPDGHLYVASAWNDRVVRYHGRTGVRIDTFASGGGLDRPIGLRFGPDHHLYVVSQGNDRILRYDGASGAFLDTFARGSGHDNWTWLMFRPDPLDGVIFADGFESGDTGAWVGSSH